MKLMKNKKENKDQLNLKEMYKRPANMVQLDIPINDVYEGLVITKDDRFVKMLEVRPQPFFLKKVAEQNRISSTFEALLKSGPEELHLKSMSLPADMTYQINDIKKCLSKESNPDVRTMGEEYISRLKDAQKYGKSVRFFVSFPYEIKQNGFAAFDPDEAVRSMNVQTNRLIRALEDCGNEVVIPEDSDYEALKTLHMVYNRDEYLEEGKTFDDRVSIVNDRYLKEMKDEQFYIPVTDYISPNKVLYANKKYQVINNTYYTFLYIPSNGYNPKVVTGWLSSYISSYAGVDVDIFLKKKPREEVINGLKRSISYSRFSISDSTDIQESFDASMSTLASAQYLRDGLSNGNDFYEMSTIITVSGSSPEQVAYMANELRLAAKNDDIILKQNLYRTEETFNMVLPCSCWNDNMYTFKKTKRNVLTEGAASMYPFTTFQMDHKDGLYFSDDMRTLAPVIFSPFNRKTCTNPHCFIAGVTGSGKTSLIQLLSLRARVRGMGCYLLCPEKQHEYKRLTNAIGGQFIDLGSGSSDRINIMEIFAVPEEIKQKMADIDGESVGNNSELMRKIASLTNFFSMYVNDMDRDEQYELQDALLETYRKFGITRDNSSLWADASHTHYKKMPIISDLVRELETREKGVNLARTIKLLTKGAGEHFDGETNIDIDNKFVVFGLQHNSDEMLPLAIFAAMDFCLSKILQDRTQKKFLMIDESWKIIMEPSGYGCKQMLANSRLLRAAECSMIIATQNLSSILSFDGGRSATEVINNCNTKILMQLNENEAYTVKEILDLTKNEVEQIRRFSQGDALMLAGETRLTMHMTPTRKEALLAFTDSESISMYREEKAKMEYEQKLKELPKSEKMLADVLLGPDDDILINEDDYADEGEDLA